MASTLQYSDKILSRHSGDLYRIASIIVDDTFNDQAIVNPLRKLAHSDDLDDDLNMGIFEVAERSKKENSSSLGFDENANYKLIGKWRGTENTTFNIVLFLCKSQTDRFHLEQAGFTMVCNQLCWSYPTESIVHILDIRQVHKVKEEHKGSVAGRFEMAFGALSAPFSPAALPADNIKSSSQIKSSSRLSRPIDEKDDDFKRVNKSGVVPLNDSDDESAAEVDKNASYVPPDKLTDQIETMSQQAPSQTKSSSLAQSLLAIKKMQKQNTVK